MITKSPIEVKSHQEYDWGFELSLVQSISGYREREINSDVRKEIKQSIATIMINAIKYYL